MKHQMKLAPTPFKLIAEGRKTVEMRLNDEKRSTIRIGDEIEFENIDTHETIRCVVLNLYNYKSFDELYSHFDKVAIGYSENEIADPKDMLAYYSPEQIEKYGALAIIIKLI